MTRPRYAREFDPPPAPPGPDQLDRTARQVRRPGGIVHRLAVAKTSRDGRVYRTDCGQRLYGAQGAVLTTADVDCVGCGR